MAVKLSDLARATKTATFDWDGEVVNLVFRPAALTPGLQLALARLASPVDPGESTGNQFASIADQTLDYLDALCKLLVSWDVLGEDGAPLPVTRANLELLPWDFLGAAYNAVQKANSPNAPTAAS